MGKLAVKSFLLFVGFALFFLSGRPAWAASWFVRSTSACPANGNGTTSACASSTGGVGAWSGLGNISWASVAPGDTINMVGGDTFIGGGITVGARGAIGNPITITVSGPGTVTIDQQNTRQMGFNFNGNPNVTIDGVRGNAVAGDTNYGIRVINIGPDGYCGYNNAGGANGEMKILHVECSGQAETGTDDNKGGFIFFNTSPGVELGFNWVHGPAASSGGTGHCDTGSLNIPNPQRKWCAIGSRVFAGPNGAPTSFTVNKVHDNRIDSLFDDGLGCGSNCSVYNNEISRVDGSGHADSIEIQTWNYVAVYNNYVHDSGDQNIYFNCIPASTTCAHTRVYNNIVKSAPGFGVVFDPEGAGAIIDDFVVVNNTFVTTSASNVRSVPRGTTTKMALKNNIFGKVTDANYYNFDSFVTSMLDGNAYDYNVYNTTSVNYPRIATWNTVGETLAQLQGNVPPREVHGAVGNPTFVNAGANDFHLASSDTVARNNGTNLTSTYSWLTTDRDGNPRPASGPWDIGAYQHAAGSQPNPPTNLRATPR